MSDTREPKTVDVSALIAGDVQFVQVDVWTEGKGLHMVKLRVVEEVDPIHGIGPCIASWWAKEADIQYCPGCGNKIKP